MSAAAVISWVLTLPAAYLIGRYLVAAWRDQRQRMTAGRLLGGAAVVAVAALVAGNVLTMPMPLAVRVGFVVLARLAVFTVAGLLVMTVVRATQPQP